MNLACVTMRLTMEEALVASTINSAAAIGVAEKVGSIEVGKRGDFLLLSTPVWEHIVYLGLGGMLTSPTGANLSGQQSEASSHVIEEVIVGGVCAARKGAVVDTLRHLLRLSKILTRRKSPTCRTSQKAFLRSYAHQLSSGLRRCPPRAEASLRGEPQRNKASNRQCPPLLS